MIRAFAITGLTAIAIATSPVATTEAHADKAFDNFLAGVATVAIIGGIVHHEKKKQRRRAAASQSQHHYHDQDHHQHNRQRVRHSHNHRGVHVHHGSQTNHRSVLRTVEVTNNRRPKQCLRQRWTNHGWVQYYAKKCLRKHQSSRTIFHYR